MPRWVRHPLFIAPCICAVAVVFMLAWLSFIRLVGWIAERLGLL